MLFNPLSCLRVYALNLISRQYFMSRFKHVMRLCKDHIHRTNKVTIDLSDYCKEFYWTTFNMVALLISEICFFEKIVLNIRCLSLRLTEWKMQVIVTQLNK